MPRWLRNQLRNAYLDKDTRLIRLLNDCWFFYRKQPDSEEDLMSLDL
jgi:hypothetical protein